MNLRNLPDRTLRSGPTGLAMLLALACTTGCPGDDVPAVDTTGEDSTGGSSTGPSTVTTPTTVTMTGADTSTGGMDTETESADGSSSGGPSCGDGVVDAGEDCDGADLGGMDCMGRGFDGGDLGCNDDCTFDESMCTLNCGNGMIDDGEECDGDDLGGMDCVTYDPAMYYGGELGCNDDCTFDAMMCVTESCGDDMINGMDVCDGADLGVEDCTTQEYMPGVFFDGGTLACAPGCGMFDTAGCYVCGDDTIGGPEVCDGTDLGGEDCITQGFEGGTLACDAACGAYDTSGCFACGDGVLNGAEECDGTDFGGESCGSLTPFPGGSLGCNLDCTIDTSGCGYTFCSTPGSAVGPAEGTITQDTIAVPALGAFVTDVNVYVDASHTWVGDLDVTVRHVESNSSQQMFDEACGNVDNMLVTFDSAAGAPPACVSPVGNGMASLPDPGTLDAYTGMPDGASTWEITILDNADGDGGTLNEWCVDFQIGPDPNNCGDGIVTFAEDCDGANLGGESCTSLGYLAGGTLACDGGCVFDTSLCDATEGICGNNTIENDGVVPDEVCDNKELNFTTCEDLGFVGGSLDCSFPTCSFDIGECSNSVIAVCATPAAAIDDAAPVNSTITVPVGSGNVADLDVHLDITHTWDADLDITLTHDATGTSIPLFTDLCGSGDDVFAFLNDEANGPANCVAPVAIEGNITPEAPALLSTFDGELAEGDWTLNVVDDAVNDSGTLNRWCIYITP